MQCSGCTQQFYSSLNLIITKSYKHCGVSSLYLWTTALYYFPQDCLCISSH